MFHCERYTVGKDGLALLLLPWRNNSSCPELLLSWLIWLVSQEDALKISSAKSFLTIGSDCCQKKKQKHIWFYSFTPGVLKAAPTRNYPVYGNLVSFISVEANYEEAHLINEPASLTILLQEKWYFVLYLTYPIVYVSILLYINVERGLLLTDPPQTSCTIPNKLFVPCLQTNTIILWLHPLAWAQHSVGTDRNPSPWAILATKSSGNSF